MAFPAVAKYPKFDEYSKVHEASEVSKGTFYMERVTPQNYSSVKDELIELGARSFSGSNGKSPEANLYWAMTGDQCYDADGNINKLEGDAPTEVKDFMEFTMSYSLAYHYIWGGIFMCREKSTKKVLGFVIAIPPNDSAVFDEEVRSWRGVAGGGGRRGG